jgi:hypothetical protein
MRVSWTFGVTVGGQNHLLQWGELPDSHRQAVDGPTVSDVADAAMAWADGEPIEADGSVFWLTVGGRTAHWEAS